MGVIAGTVTVADTAIISIGANNISNIQYNMQSNKQKIEQLKKERCEKSTTKANDNIEPKVDVPRLPDVDGKGLIGRDFEDFLTNQLGGEGSFKMGGREFDGGVGNKWWEAKSGNYWDDIASSESGLAKFKSDMGDRLRIAKENGATYELHSNTPIPQNVKDWLTNKGINFREW